MEVQEMVIVHLYCRNTGAGWIFALSRLSIYLFQPKSCDHAGAPPVKYREWWLCIFPVEVQEIVVFLKYRRCLCIYLVEVHEIDVLLKYRIRLCTCPVEVQELALFLKYRRQLCLCPVEVQTMIIYLCC